MTTYDTVPFFLVIAFSHAYNRTKKKRFCLDYMKRSKIFFQDKVFDHRVVSKRLHKGLHPFTNAGLHKKGVWSPGDVRWGACLP
jgi:hypothetical protein